MTKVCLVHARRQRLVFRGSISWQQSANSGQLIVLAANNFSVSVKWWISHFSMSDFVGCICIVLMCGICAVYSCVQYNSNLL